MRAHGKQYNAAATRRDLKTAYQARKALELVKTGAFAKFDETVEVAVRLGVDPRHADQVVRGTVVLPAGTGKSVRVLVIAVGDKLKEAQDAGADFVGIEYIQKIKDGWLDFDVLIATPDQMGQLGALGRILGPRGLMPNPKAGTVTFDVAARGEGDQGGQDRVPGGQGGQSARGDRQGLVRRSTRWNRTSRPSWTHRALEAERDQGRVRPQRRRVEHDGARRHASTPPPTGNEP